MTVHQTGQNVGEIGVGIDAGEFAALDQAGEDRPVLGAFV
jgi:hypothetical protein